MSRQAHPLAPADYLVPAARLPRAHAAPWMRRALVATALLSVVAALGVALGPMSETVPVSGEIRPAGFVYASPATEGLLAKVSVSEGDAVSEGQLLATLDDWALARELRQLDAELETARAELLRAEAAARRSAAVPVGGEFIFSAREAEKQRELLALQRHHLANTEKLASLGSASSVDVLNLRMQVLASEALLARHERAAELAAGDYGRSALAEAEAARDSAAARVRVLEIRRRGLEEERERLAVRAPRAGVVTATARLYPGLAVHPGDALFKIAEPGPAVLRLRAGEDRISELRPGQIVRFRPRSNPDRLAPYATAVLVSITPDRELDGDRASGSGDYLIDAGELSAPYPLPPGARVAAEIVLSERPFFRRWFLSR
jgi:multidrug resistance efflux pump